MEEKLLVEIKRIKKIMLLEQAPGLFRDLVTFFKSNVQDLRPFISNRRAQEILDKGIDNISKEEGDLILKNLKFKSFANNLIQNNFISTTTLDRMFDDAINKLKSKQTTFRGEKIKAENLKFIEATYRRAYGLPNDAVVPDGILKLQKEFNPLLFKRFEERFAQKEPELYKKLSPPKKDLLLGLKKWIDVYNNDILATWTRLWVNGFKLASKLQREFINEHKLAMEAIAKGKDEKYHFKRMAELLAATRKTFLDSPKNIYEGVSGQNNGWKHLIPPEFRIKLEADLGWKAIYDEMSKSKTVYEVFNVEMQAFKKAWPFRWPRKGGNPPGWFIFSSNAESYTRFIRLILFADPRTGQEWIDALIRRGVITSLSSQLVSRIGMHTILIPAFLGVVKTITIASVSWAEYWTNYVMKLFDSDSKPYDWVDYQDDAPNRKGVFTPEFLEQFRKSIPKTWVRWTYAPEFLDLWNLIQSGKLDLNDTEKIMENSYEEARKACEQAPEICKEMCKNNPDFCRRAKINISDTPRVTTTADTTKSTNVADTIKAAKTDVIKPDSATMEKIKNIMKGF
jgi:hypothetical protein